MATTVFLARHGQSDANDDGRIAGQLDVGLSTKGAMQADALADCLRAEPLAAVYTSTLRRTVDTARPTAEALGLAITSVAGLDEMHMGELQGRFRDERDPDASAQWARWHADPWGFEAPGGESFADVVERVAATVGSLLDRHADEQVLVVGHRITSRVMLGTLLGWPRDRWDEIRLRHKYCYRVELGDGPPHVTTCTLTGESAGRRVDGLVM